jgi:hypothetical protein
MGVANVVDMVCRFCKNTTRMMLPNGHPACPFCGRPWWWSEQHGYSPLYKENTEWAKGWSAKVASRFQPLHDPSEEKERPKTEVDVKAKMWRKLNPTS